jgi:TonB family protein
MKILFTALIAFISMHASAQQVIKINGQDSGNIVTNPEIPAMFPLGDDAWKHFLAKRSNYSIEDTRDSTEGTVVVQFIVGTSGNLSDIEVVSGPTTGGYRDEAVRLIRLSRLWMPAVDKGHQVSSYRQVPIHFKMK